MGVCLGVSRSRGVLREGLAKGAGPRALQPRAKGVEGRRKLGGEVERRLSAPGASCSRDAVKERLVWADGAGVRGPSPVKEQHLPPGVEKGRNGPEHRPGSETPRPLLRSGRRAGRKSVTLTPPLPQRVPCRSPLPSDLTPPGGRRRA